MSIKKKIRKRYKIISNLLLAISILLCAYPFLCEFIQSNSQKDAITTYYTEIQTSETIDFETIRSDAHKRIDIGANIQELENMFK